MSLADLRAPREASPDAPAATFCLRDLLSGRGPQALSAADVPAWHPGDFLPGGPGGSPYWEEVLSDAPNRRAILSWLRDGVRFSDFATPFASPFGAADVSLLPPRFAQRNHPPVQPGGAFHAFAVAEVAEGVRNGSMRVWGLAGSCVPPWCVHPLSVEPKKPRLCYDQRFANQWTPPPPTSYDCASDLARSVPSGGDPLLTTWDLKSGYFHVRLHPDSETFFGFLLDGVYYVYRVIPFGWNCSAFIFQSVTSSVGAFLRTLGLRVFIYLDDASTVSCDGLRAALVDMAVEGSLLYLLRFFVSHKSALAPAACQRWLGLLIDVRARTFSLPEDKIAKFLALLGEVQRDGCVSEATLSRIAGKCVAFSPAVPGAQLFARPLFDALAALQRRPSARASSAPLVGPLRDCVELWTHLRDLHGTQQWRSERHFQVSLSFSSDASAVGWGAVVCLVGPDGSPSDPVRVGDAWAPDELSLHINVKEFIAFPRALAAGLPASIRDAIIRVGTDSTVALGWLMSGRAARHPAALRAQLELFDFQRLRNALLQGYHIPGAQNAGPDGISRAPYSHEESLSPALFSLLERRFGPFSLDAMASAANSRCRRYVSRFRSPSSVGADVFSFPVGAEPAVYCFPPFPLIGAVVSYFAEQRARGVLVLPCDHSAPWWSALVGCSRLPLAPAGSSSAVARPAGVHGFEPVVLRLPLVAVAFDFRLSDSQRRRLML